jgi:hypothetical protein
MKEEKTSIFQDKKNTKKKKVLEQLRLHKGIVTSACDSSGIHRSTFYAWIDQDDDFAREVKSIKEDAIDFVESRMMKRIEEGSDTMIIFFLKTQAKKRGYVERQEVAVNDQRPDLSELTTDEIKRLLNEEE